MSDLCFVMCPFLPRRLQATVRHITPEPRRLKCRISVFLGRGAFQFDARRARLADEAEQACNLHARLRAQRIRDPVEVAMKPMNSRRAP